MITKSPLVSIIIPSYNHGKFVERAMLSVLNQTYPNVELIVVDGASTDNTVSILQRYTDKIQWVCEPDSGESHAMNKGIRMATGEIFNFLCADDTLQPTAVEAAVKAFLENPNAGMVFGDQILIDEDDNPTGLKILQRLNLYYLLNVHPGIVSQPSTFIIKRVFDQIGLWSESLHYASDLDLWIRILSHYEGVYVPQPFGNVRRHTDRKSAKRLHRALLESFKVRRRYGAKVFSKATLNIIKAEIRYFLGKF